MIILDPGHKYLLDNLKDGSQSELRFYKDVDINGDGYSGPSCQEVTRALIDRVFFLDLQKPSRFNAAIVTNYRQAIAGFEMRAMELAVERGWPIENTPVNLRGHIV